MITQTIITVAIIIVLFIIFFKIFKTVLKAISFVILIIIIASLVAGYFVYQDMQDLQKNFASEPKLFLLEDNNKIMAGVIIEGAENNTNIIEVLQEEQDKYTQYLKQNDLKSIKGNNYKLFILKKEFFNSGVQIEEKVNLTNQQAIQVMTADEAIKAYAQIENTNETSLANQTTNADVRSKIFIAALSSELNNSGGTLYIIQQINKGNAKVYPKTAAFILTEYLPNQFIERVKK